MGRPVGRPVGGGLPGPGDRGREGGVLATTTGALRYPGQALSVPAGPDGCGTASAHVHAIRVSSRSRDPRQLTFTSTQA